MQNTINYLEVNGIWNKYDLHWHNLNPDVNILIGINGSGKTTLFNVIDSLIKADTKKLKTYNITARLDIDKKTIIYNKKTTPSEIRDELGNINYQKISTFDVPLKDKIKNGKEYSQLYNELHDIIYSIGNGEPSFSAYRLQATNFPDQAEHINQRIQEFFKVVNRLFGKTNKTLTIDPWTNMLVFDNQGEKIQLYSLSSGEKQLLIILLRVFLMDNQPYILLMDEPEISLHIEWQYRLIEEIRALNPNCQIITSTHSPSLFGDGWSDKLFFIEDLITSTSVKSK